MSERGPAAHGGLDAVLELRCRRPASDGLSEGRVASSGHRGVDRQENKKDSTKEREYELELYIAIEVVYPDVGGRGQFRRIHYLPTHATGWLEVKKTFPRHLGSHR
jgi:hypothetical protein